MIDWDQVDTVLLDMDGTLLDLHFDNYFWLEHLPAHYAARHELDGDIARTELVQMFEQQRGTLNWYCLDFWDAELDVDVAELKQEVKHLIAIRPFVEEFLSRLKHSDREVLLITNAHPKSLNLKLEETGIGEYFDAIISSHEFQVPKEEQLFWQNLQQRHPFRRERTLFIDDSAPVLASAERYGIRYLLTLLQPDSTQLPRSTTDYPGFHHFDEIMPKV